MLTLAPVVLFEALGEWSGSKASRWCAFAWIVYGLYECLILNRVVCSVGCDIRSDLMLIAPALVVLSFYSFVKAMIGIFGKSEKGYQYPKGF